MNVADVLYVHAHDRPDHPAIEDDGKVISYSQLAAMIDRVAAQLQARGIGTGDLVVITLPDSAEYIAVLFGLAKIGAASLSIDERAPNSERLKAIRGMKIKNAIVRDSSTGFLDHVAIPLGALFENSSEDSTASGPTTGTSAFDADTPLMVLQSSGTTGEPKRFFITHRQIVERNRRLIAMMGLTSSDRYFQVPHLHFQAGCRRCIAMMMLGATVVLNRAGTIAEYARFFSGCGITYVYLTPYHLRTLLAQVTSDAPLWPNLKIVVSAAPITQQEKLLARQRLTPLLFESYGTNEVGDLALATPADQNIHPDSIGRLLTGIEAQVVDVNNAPLPAGETGQIRLRGPHFLREYLGNPAATARHFMDGWFYPGDLAALDEDGYIFLKGRADDVINNAGAKYYPVEVEAVLLSNPAVTDAVVFGGSHPELGEVSIAYVVCSAHLTAKDLYNFCQGKIAMYKAPQWIFFLDELPRVATGKPDKKKLKEHFHRYLGEKNR